jgi:hypothetical protein
MTMEHDDDTKLEETKEDEFTVMAETQKEGPAGSAKEPIKLSRRRIDVLQYFSNLPVNRQLSLMEEHGIDFAKLAEAVSQHRKSALVDEELAVEKMLTERSPNRIGEKAALLEMRYRASIEVFAKRGLTPVMIATHLSKVERKNYPRRAKDWCFTPAMIGRFMKDNGIAVVKK